MRTEGARLDSIATYLRFAIFKTRALGWTMLHAVLFVIITSIAASLFDGREATAVIDQTHKLLLTDLVAQATSSSDFANWFAQTLPRLNRAQQPRAQDLSVVTPFAQATYIVNTGNSSHFCDNSEDLLIVQDMERDRLRDECYTNTVDLGQALGRDFTFYFPAPAAIIDSQTTVFSTTVLRDDDADIVATIPLYMDDPRAFTVARARYNSDTASANILVVSPGVYQVGRDSGNRHVALLVFMCLASVAVVVEAVGDTLIEFHISRSIPNVLTLKLLFDVAVVVLTIVYCVITARLLALWNSSGTFSTPSSVYDALQDGTLFARSALSIFSIAYALYFLRLGFHLRYWNRFAIVSNMLISAFPALVGCLLAFGILLVAFASLGVVMFGNFSTDFSQLSTSIAFLIYVLYNGGSMNYTPYLDASPIATPIYFLLFHYWAQLIVFNVVVGVFAAAFGAVVHSQNLFAPISWAFPVVLADLTSVLRRTYVFRRLRSWWTGQRDRWVDYTETRVLLAQYVEQRLEHEPGSTTVTAAELLAHVTLPGCSDGQARQIFAKVITAASRENGNGDGVEQGFKRSLAETRVQQQMESNFWRQARIIQDLYSSVCVGSNANAVPLLQADAEAAAAAGENIRRSADLMRQDRDTLLATIFEARNQTDKLTARLNMGAQRAEELRASVAQLRRCYQSIKEAVEKADVSLRRE